MANKTKKVVIITTKDYPTGNDWESGYQMDVNRLGLFTKDYGIIGLCASLDLPGNASKTFKSNPCVKTKKLNNDEWVTCVVPCMKNSDSDKIALERKCQYIEYILELCSNGIEANNVYLVAHDKDFVNFDGVKGGELLKEKHIPTHNCVRLKKLVGIGHAYMFQHDINYDVGKLISKIDKINISDNDNGNEKFEENDFKKLLDIIDAEWEMNDFFSSVNKNQEFKYPMEP